MPTPLYEPKFGSPLLADQAFYGRLGDEIKRRSLVDSFIAPIRSGKAWPVRAGQVCRIVAVEGLAGFAELPVREFERLFRSGQRLDGSTAPLDLFVRTGAAEPRELEVPLSQFDEYLAPIGRRLEGGLGYLELPGVSSGPKAATYDDTVHELLGLTGVEWQSLYHFSMGMAVDDPRLTTDPGYAWEAAAK